MVYIKAIVKFLWISIRPISKAEGTLGMIDIMNLIPPIALIFPDIHKWVAGWWNLYWAIGIPLTLVMIAGIKLQIQAIPRLEIIFNPNKYPKCKSELEGQTIYRVGVVTHGAKTIDDVHVVLSEMYPLKGGKSSSILPQELNPSNVQPGTESGAFILNPNDPNFVNVATWKSGEEISLYYQEIYKFKSPPKKKEWRRPIPHFIAPEAYDLVLVASGRDTPPVAKFFRLEVVDTEFRFYSIKRKPKMYKEDSQNE